MNITVVDHTAQWREWVSAAAGRWHDALAPRGITISYEWGVDPYLPRLLYRAPTDGVIRVSDAQRWANTWVWWGGAWTGGDVHLDRTPPVFAEFAIAICCREFGYAFGLVDVDSGETVMTRVPTLAYPTASDAANAMRGYPLAPNLAPLPPGTHKHHGGKGKKQH